jgi:hypothetical protein
VEKEGKKNKNKIRDGNYLVSFVSRHATTAKKKKKKKNKEENVCS